MTPAHHVRVPAPGDPPLRGHLPFADAPGAADPIEVNSRWLTRGGRPWFPVSGEFHPTRYPAGEWEEELLKMKAGGVTVVAAYVIWIHHEEAEGRIRFDGDRDLRRFAELCARHGLDLIPRIGPWVHAEVRNGGLPDWVLDRTDAPRTDDPAYLAPVHTWFTAIAGQLHGLDRSNGGPVVAIQIENELYDRPGHLLTLKRMAQEAGLSAPLWTSTAWGGVRLPPDELLPLYGGYTETFWTEADGGWPDTCRKHFFFTHQRDDEGIGADLRPTTVRGADPAASADRFPWATCELGGGMAVAYHRRPRVDAADIGALGLTKIGCGSVWQGYYMFHGGTNPPGDLTPLQESHATGYPNDLPVLTYDFQAPLGEYGQYRPSYDELRLQHLLLADFGHLIAPMDSALPERRPTGQDDRETLRWAVRGDGRSGFLFVNNHQPHEPLPDHPGTTFTVEFPDGPDGPDGTGGPPGATGSGGATGRVLSLPSAPVTIPRGAYLCWPLRLDVAGLRLDWATAQPVCTVDDGHGRTVLVLAATDGITPELALDIRTVTTVSVPSGQVTTVGDRILVTGLRPGTDALVEVDTTDGSRVGLLVLDAATARTAYRGHAWGAERLVLADSDGGVVFDAHTDEVRVHSATPEPSFAVLPAPARPPMVTGAVVKEATDGVLVRYTVVARDAGRRGTGGADGELPVTLVRPAGQAPPVTTGVLGRASVPADEHFDTVAAEYDIVLPDDAPPGSLLRVHWTGDVARAYVGDRLVADQFYSGGVWDIGLDRVPVAALRAEGLRLRVLPLPAGAPVYVPGWAGDSGIPAGIVRAELITTHTWALRPG
ncbi:beta-galactosidase [Streptomyces europaeiscabiei]|uniref:Beta-galactosidase n=1 Tax=Streptomyces europaeiscabiei TaxID=146819 RepID=A0ABU4N711_9ACTN|nr:beta-galactosidase [Streptomyces europaeiscabiei]MDX2523312.1 beta-galactosidase [Streptomyces europaeiscabiei]MDX3542773.1 beta-galactosidase [Streptomyces europaeiscabiei]MDX3550617.1 beta-galactosidase [Streptomyces europaeiscabiei]MDX3698823.1 beta-galactosidase [Streptomyces europaeiscabiei]